MALKWDQVQTEFAGDETTNFGPREETGTALYQVDTIATISAENDTAGKVQNLVSAALGELVTVAVDHHLSIFKESEHVTTVEFENLVEDCAWSPDGALLLVVDSGGKAHLIDVHSMQFVFVCKLVQGSKPGERAFHRITVRSGEEMHTCDLVLLSATGLLFVVKDFSSCAFSQGEGDLANVMEQFRKVDTSEVHTNVTWDAVPMGGGSVMTVGGGDNILAVWTWMDDRIALGDCISDILEAECAIIGAKLASNGNLLYCLDERNQISVWAVPQFVMLSIVNLNIGTERSIRDFLHLETQGTQTNSQEGTCLVLLLNDLLSTTLQIRNLESGTDVYTLQLGASTSLSKCVTTQESLYVAEGTTVPWDPTEVSTVRLRCLTETEPKTRLQRILHKKRFEEALQFAKLFHLDTELVYTAQMNQLLEQLSPWNVVCYDDKQVSSMLEQLWTSIHNVKDSELVAENCMRVALPSLSDTEKLLQMCQTKMVLGLQNRLMTFKLVYGSNLYSANSWIRFQQANLLHLVCRDMTQHQPHNMVLVWRRHCEEWRDQMTVEIVRQYLQVVAEQLPADSVLKWLKDLLPYLATILPEAVEEVIKWALQRACRMEEEEKSGWPHNAVDFLETLSRGVTTMTDVNFTATNDTPVEMAMKSQIDVHSMLSPVRSALTQLHQLQHLLTYNLRLSMKQLQQETTETLAYRMLDQVVMIDLIKPTLEKYITPYIRAHCLDQDNIFATYIKDLLERLGDVRSYTGQSAWEDKVLAIMNFINNPKEKCCAVLNVIRHAPLPWSPDIQKLVEEGFKIRHPLVQELKEAKKIADIRLLMQEYGLKGRAVPDQKRAERLAMHIVEQDKPNSLADTLRVLKEYNISTLKTRSEIFLRYSNRLIINDRVIEYMQVLRSLDVSEAQRLVERVVSLAEICLDEDPPEPMVKKVIDEHKKHMTMAAVLSLLYILPKTTDRFEVDELNIQLETFSGLLALQREYQMILPVSEYREEKNRRRIFASFTQRYLEENTPFQGSGKLTVLYRLADLLQLQREAVQGDLAVDQGRAGNWNAVLFLCRELLKAEDGAQVGQIFSRVVRELLQLQGQGCFDGGDDGDQAASQSQHLPIILEKLADRAVVMCDAKSLASCLEVSKSARLWRKVCSQCEVTDTALLQLEPMEVKSASEGPLQMHSLDTLYSDEALILNSSIALPIAAASLDATLVFQKNEEGRNAEDTQGASVQNASAHFQPIISHLRENDHLQLSLHFLIHTASSLRQSLLKHDMGFPLSPQVKSWLDEQRTEMLGTEKRSVQLFNSLTSSLALKVLSARHVDHQMALAYLLSAPRKVGVDCLMKSIASCNFNFRRLGVIANVGQALGHLLKEAKLISTCQELETNAAWGVRLGKLKISFKKAFQGGLSDKHDVIASMARCERVDIRMVAEFSEDFKMDVEDSQLVFLEELLKTSPAPWQLDRARTVVSAVEAQDPLLNKLKTIYKQTSPYEYEVIEFLFGEMNRLDPSPLYEKGLKLVSYLKMYTRRNPPSDEELNSASVVQENLEECGDAGDKLPQLSAQRVPLHPLLEAERWKVITPELDGESVPQWLQIAQLLEIPADEVCVIAVQNIVRRHVSNLSSPSSRSPAGGIATDKGKSESLRSWQVSETSLQTQEQVQQLLLRVKSCEMALACANWVVRELPMGGDRALALRGCVEFAQRWYTICDDNTPQQEKAQAALLKFQKVLRKVQTVQALHQSNLAEPQLTKLASSPVELIECLTEHSAVIAEGTEPAPDVFSTVQKVCEVNDLDIGQVLVTGMRKWLLASDSAVDMDTTMNLSFSCLKMTKEEVECSQHDNIKRVLYFLHRAPRPLMLKFLINTIENGTEEGTSHLGRMNCLYCLLQIGDNADLQPLGLSYQSLREMLRVSCYLTQLEELHIQHSVQTLNDCNKMGLVKAIWRNHKHQKSAVKLSAALCLDYKLYDRQQWAVMLQQMVNLQMLLELEHVLQRLHSVPALWSLPVFVSAWQTVLITELRKASLPLSDKQTRSCLHSFNLLESCPVLSQVDLCAMKQQFLNLELDVCAAACLLMDLSASPTDVKELLNQDPAKFIEQSYSLTALGMSLPSAKKVREVLFQLVLEQGDYHLISQSASQDFAHFIISWDDIDGCLQFGLSSNMFSQANKLLELYCQYYPEKYDEVVAWCENSGFQMDSILEGYVHMKKLA